jgi:hypothetical protein
MHLVRRPPLGAESAMREGFRLMVVGVAATEQVTLSTEGIALLFGWLDDSGINDDSDAEKLLEAQVALVRIVHDAALAAQEQGDTEVSASIIKTIRRRLCPLPPWIQPPCDE